MLHWRDQHLVDQVNHTILRKDVGLDDVGIVNHHTTVDHDGDLGTVQRGGFGQVDHLCANASGSASSDSSVPGGSAANASSVGANTVNGPSTVKVF